RADSPPPVQFQTPVPRVGRPGFPAGGHDAGALGGAAPPSPRSVRAVRTGATAAFIGTGLASARTAPYASATGRKSDPINPAPPPAGQPSDCVGRGPVMGWAASYPARGRAVDPVGGTTRTLRTATAAGSMGCERQDCGSRRHSHQTARGVIAGPIRRLHSKGW